jgi:hypothetical protein
VDQTICFSVGSPKILSVFLEEGVLKFFLEVMVTFQDEHEVVTNVLDVISNIAEVPQLRPCFMMPEFMTNLRYGAAFSCANLNYKIFLSVFHFS